MANRITRRIVHYFRSPTAFPTVRTPTVSLVARRIARRKARWIALYLRAVAAFPTVRAP